MTPEKPNKHLPAEQRRAATVEAVVELAAERNPGDITTAAIAGRMGLTQGAIFRHFPNKSAILQAVMEWVAERLLARIEKAVQGETSPLAALERMFMAHVDFVCEHPGIPRMLFSELQNAEETPAKRMVRTLIRRYGERVQQLIDQGKNPHSPCWLYYCRCLACSSTLRCAPGRWPRCRSRSRR